MQVGRLSYLPLYVDSVAGLGIIKRCILAELSNLPEQSALNPASAVTGYAAMKRPIKSCNHIRILFFKQI